MTNSSRKYCGSGKKFEWMKSSGKCLGIERNLSEVDYKVLVILSNEKKSSL